MELRFFISGSLVCTTHADEVPPVGSEATICMDTYKKGMWPGTILKFRISEEFPPVYEDDGVVYIDVDGWTVLKEGVEPAKG